MKCSCGAPVAKIPYGAYLKPGGYTALCERGHKIPLKSVFRPN